MSKLNYQEKIPNNVNLSNDMSLQRALNIGNQNLKAGGKKWGLKIFKKMKCIFGLQFQ